MSAVRDCTLVFLVKRTHGEVSEICLAMKKRGFGAGRWNGVGGKVETGETIAGAAIREAREEVGVETHELLKVAELLFNFSHNPAWDQLVHAYFCESWSGEPHESEEMAPQWFARSEIPFVAMWPDDELWMPHVLDGKRVKAQFTFGENDTIHSHDVRVVPQFDMMDI